MTSSQDIRTYLGRRIQFHRKLRQFSQATLAEKVNISIVALSQIERGIRYPTAETLSRIMNSLEVDVCELFLESEPTVESKDLLARYKSDILSTVLSSVQKSIQKSVNAVHSSYTE